MKTVVSFLQGFFSISIGTNRIFGLDLLRAVAILFVMIAHSQILLPADSRHILNLVTLDGVSMFFVLSGFLIGGILIKIIERQEFNTPILLNFWSRRWFRTVPNYLLILTILTIYHVVLQKDITIQTIAPYFIFSQNIFTAHPHFFTEAWSLSIEEWFYLLVPILILVQIAALRFTPRNAVITTACMVILTITAFRLYRYLTIDVTTTEQYIFLFHRQVSTRIDSIMFGVLGAYIQHYHAARWIRHKFVNLIAGISIFIFMKFLSEYIEISKTGMYSCVFSFSLMSLATLLLLPYLSNMQAGKGFIYKWITTISLISYSMYLVNLSLVQGIIMKHFSWYYIFLNRTLLFSSKLLTFWIMTISLSMVIFKYYEIPLTALRDKKWNSK